MLHTELRLAQPVPVPVPVARIFGSQKNSFQRLFIKRRKLFLIMKAD
ncbi:hypothetical protein P353_13470 [Comamonas testosteroni]|uniref:Uncharacterized protein n=1 Tax=Comamonas testosteroni TaxID=285 RepID=A0A096GX35_COMTE|nr:hypothetical protein P353_13470 [Comamonas testosteroni]